MSVGNDEVDGKIRTSTIAKYVNDLAQLVVMYTTDISVIQSQIPRLITLTTFGWYCLLNVIFYFEITNLHNIKPSSFTLEYNIGVFIFC